MSDLIHHPHDTVFKQAMQNIEVAKDLLAQHLPDTIKQLIDWQALSISNASYITEDLKQSASDILYQTTIDNEDAYLFLLCEHQSTPDKRMPLRLLDYTVRIMQDHVTQGHDTLPLVVPIVIYAGKQSPYPYSCDIFELFALPNKARELMFQPATLVDLTDTDDDTLLQTKWASFLQIILKHARDRDEVLTVIKKWAEKGYADFILTHQGESYLLSVLYYLYNTAEIEDKTAFIDTIKHTKSLEGLAMNLATQFRREGWQEGRQEGEMLGMQRGRQEGRQEGEMLGVQKGKREERIAMAKAMLTHGESYTKVMQYTQLTAQQIKRLEKSINA